MRTSVHLRVRLLHGFHVDGQRPSIVVIGWGAQVHEYEARHQVIRKQRPKFDPPGLITHREEAFSGV